METIHTDSPLAAYLEGEGTFEFDDDDHENHDPKYPHTPENEDTECFQQSFAPSARAALFPRVNIPQLLPAPPGKQPPKSAITRAHHAWSSAVNSRLGASDNARFLEHFRYTIVASQLLNEYLDHGSLAPAAALPTRLGLDGCSDETGKAKDTANLVGALSAAAVAFALVYFIDWLRTRRVSRSRAALLLGAIAITAFVGYGYLRRQWLDSLRHEAVDAATGLTTNWQAFELSSSSALSFIQEVELVSKGYRLSTPLPPASRVEESGTARRCAKLRAALHKAYATAIPACIEAHAAIRALIEEDDLDKYFEVYDISSQDAKESSGPDALRVLEDDAESLKSLRVLSYRAGVLRRVTLCSLMAVEADGGKLDFSRWRAATNTMGKLSKAISGSAERIRLILSDMESFSLPSPAFKNAHTPHREKMRGQVRKISALGTGIRGLQAKMQILREETNNSIEQTEDLTDLGPTLMAQYEAIGADLRELLQAWEAGKQSLQSNISRHERRISMASSGLRSPVSSLGGLTAVEEVVDGPGDALRVLNGDGTKSHRSSLNTTSDEEEMVFEAVAMPRQRASTLTREERIAKMHEQRAKQQELRSQRDANTSMLRELESVINLRPKKATTNGAQPARVTSL
ncbi:Putative Myosin-binding domain-containing protein [Septoria linicola]|uniref:Vezatin n=1 Tax=Septoria linicola TaxID=215465 RepID=A0A9Q9EK53_9PEZI|nr:putative Myosin-binding domain-containing protein [Septoria linicola]USW54451.1 Putative Myosin-binding domain-containing protein [Septoria linicola]